MKLALHVVALLFSLASFETLSAQPFYPPFGSLPPHEALAIVRSKGLYPVSRPVRQGPVYVLRALNPGGQEFRVLVDATTGRIVKVVAVAPSDPGGFAPPATIPSGHTVPDGTGPNPGMAIVPPDSDDDDFEPLHPAPAAAAPKAPSRTAAKPAPPLPRPRPKEIAAAPVPEPMSSDGPTSSTGPSSGNAASASSSVGASSTGASTGPSANAEYTPPQFLELDE